jgi:hypothetical protein
MGRGVSLVALALAVVLSGCFMDAKVNGKGAGTLVVKIRLTNEAQLDPSKKRFESAFVKVTSAKIDPDKWASFELQFDDITKLPTTAYFQTCAITLTDGDAGTRILTLKNVNKTPSKVPEEMIAYFGNEVRFSVTVPGEIVKSNATTTAGQTAAWTWGLSDFTNTPELNLNVTFKASPAGEKAGAHADNARSAGGAADNK